MNEVEHDDSLSAYEAQRLANIERACPATPIHHGSFCHAYITFKQQKTNLCMFPCLLLCDDADR